MFVLDILTQKSKMPDPDHALPGRDEKVDSGDRHFVNRNPLHGPYPKGFETALFGLGCFWGAERKFWELEGVWVTAVGYAGGFTKNATYNEVCTGRTGHNEVVFVVFDPAVVSYEALLKLFFESHDPTQGMRQGNDVGTQYRSGIYTYSPQQRDLATAFRDRYQAALIKNNHRGKITTEILDAPPFYFAEEYHQQYLAKNPQGYCGLGGTGVACPVGTEIPS